MTTPLTGSWQCVRSNIPNYQPGNEWLHFGAEGDHVWETAQPGGRGRPARNRVTLKAEGDGYRLRYLIDGVETKISARIDRLGSDEIAVVPVHGFTSVFARMTPPKP